MARAARGSASGPGTTGTPCKPVCGTASPLSARDNNSSARTRPLRSERWCVNTARVRGDAEDTKACTYRMGAHAGMPTSEPLARGRGMAFKSNVVLGAT